MEQNKENQIKIFKNNEFSEIRAIEKGGESWFVGNDIAISLGYKHPHQAITKHCKNAKLLKSTENGIKGLTLSPHGIKVINEQDVITLISKCRFNTNGASEWILSILKNKNYIPIVVRDEFIALKTIEQLLKIDLVRQYRVGPFSIDGYDKQNNVAYEIDEPKHLNYKNEDNERQRFIENAIGCEFVRIKL